MEFNSAFQPNGSFHGFLFAIFSCVCINRYAYTIAPWRTYALHTCTLFSWSMSIIKCHYISSSFLYPKCDIKAHWTYCQRPIPTCNSVFSDENPNYCRKMHEHKSLSSICWNIFFFKMIKIYFSIFMKEFMVFYPIPKFLRTFDISYLI